MTGNIGEFVGIPLVSDEEPRGENLPLAAAWVFGLWLHKSRSMVRARGFRTVGSPFFCTLPGGEEKRQMEDYREKELDAETLYKILKTLVENGEGHRKIRISSDGGSGVQVREVRKYDRNILMLER